MFLSSFWKMFIIWSLSNTGQICFARWEKLAETIWKGVFVLVGQEGSLWDWRWTVSPGKMRSLHSLDEKEAISFLISFFLINFFSFFLRPVFLTNYLIYTIEYNKREGFGETLLQRFNSFPHHFLTHLSLLRPQQLFN